MCGLIGVLGSRCSPETDLCETVSAMTACLGHRGPDAEGIWIADGIALGHMRLSILDLSPAGAQPMLSASSRYVIAYNGEIYNHLELRQEMEASGAAQAWRGHSDTETLLAAFEYWGLDETLRRAAGMFAIALWDCREQRLFLARDRMGEKPLYWGWVGKALVFGSELKALRQYPGFPRGICREATVQYLRFGYIPAPRSIHRGIYKLEPGCILEVKGSAPEAAPEKPLRPGESLGNLSIRRYWSLNRLIENGAEDQFGNEEEALTALDTTLNRAVSRQMIADVPLGAFLSGGVDSSLIVALMQQQSCRPVQTFTVGFENADFDESPYAASVAQHLGTDHTALVVTNAETWNVIPNLPDLYDEPFADSSQIPTHLVCHAARQRVTVALSGDAGDELFGGYNRYFWGPKLWNRLQHIPHPLRRMMGYAMTTLPVEGWNRLGQFHQSFSPRSSGVSRLGEKVHKLAATFQKVKGIDDLYRGLVTVWDNPEFLVNGAVEPNSVLSDMLPAVLNNDPAARMMAQDMRSYLPDDILCKVDRAAMGISLETRVPFLDPDLLALSARLPAQMKIRDGQGKWALRQILYRHVPRELIERPKTGFSIPIGDWLRGPLRDWAEDLLSEKRLEADGLLDPAPIRQAWAEHLSGRRDWTHRLWTILMLQAWRERWQ